MSDKEGSLSRSASRSLSHDRSIDSDGRSSRKSDRSVTPLSVSRSRSRSRSRSNRRYSRSRSRSRSRRRYRSRSWSRSPNNRDRRRRSRYSRSRSRSYGRSSPYGERRRGSRYRSHSRSPMSNRRRHCGNRDDPKTSKCIGVFGLSLYTQERDLRDVFGRYGPIDEVQVVYDHQTGRSRGFAFIYFRNLEDSEEAKESAPGTEIDGRRIRVDYSITERAHTPTPGIYLGKPTSSHRRSDYHRRSSSPGSRRGRNYSYSRSRSRSYSPRRY